MTPHLSVITLGVDNLERAVAFYRDGLGWPTKGIIGTEFEHGAVAFFSLNGGLRLALWPRTSLAHDAGLPPPSGSAAVSGSISLGHNVESAEAVDAVMSQAIRAGGSEVKPAQPTFYGGYAGYFADTEGHLWEVVYNPALGDL